MSSKVYNSQIKAPLEPGGQLGLQHAYIPSMFGLNLYRVVETTRDGTKANNYPDGQRRKSPCQPPDTSLSSGPRCTAQSSTVNHCTGLTLILV